MTVTATFYAGAKVRHTSAGDLGTPLVDIDTGRKTVEFTNGTTAGKADLVFRDTRQLAGNASESLDLAGSLLDAFGATITFAKIVGIHIKAHDDNVADIVVGNAASNAFVGPFGAATHTMAVKPGGTLTLTAPKGGWAVTAGTADLLKVLNGSAGSAANYDIVLLGTSA